VSQALWDEIEQLSEISRNEILITRNKDRVKITAEVFTPTKLVIRLLQQLPEESFGPGKNVLDPACGDGQFLAVIKFAKIIIWNETEEEALSEIFGIDILSENVKLCRKRLRGGTIVVGDALNPTSSVPGQTKNDKELILELTNSSQRSLF
jgi:SAM-dependent methyltransferase